MITDKKTFFISLLIFFFIMSGFPLFWKFAFIILASFGLMGLSLDWKEVFRTFESLQKKPSQKENASSSVSVSEPELRKPGIDGVAKPSRKRLTRKKIHTDISIEPLGPQREDLP